MAAQWAGWFDRPAGELNGELGTLVFFPEG